MAASAKPLLNDDDRTAVVARFDAWVRKRQIAKPNGQHVVRFCAEMWVADAFPGDLGIPTVWGVLRAAGSFSARLKCR